MRGPWLHIILIATAFSAIGEGATASCRKALAATYSSSRVASDVVKLQQDFSTLTEAAKDNVGGDWIEASIAGVVNKTSVIVLYTEKAGTCGQSGVLTIFDAQTCAPRAGKAFRAPCQNEGAR